VALSTIVLIVISTLLVHTLVDKGPVIFLKLAQITNGEIDAYLTPMDAKYVNFTALTAAVQEAKEKNVKKSEAEYHISPRKVFEGRVIDT
jgi:2-keto-4-pentenoate hydratase/2-oxohepta-3-ene-1,7-dioic acid hydratase in catechol pathway